MHTPVLLHEVIQHLNIKDDGVYLDLTVGYGGHASAILERARRGFLVGIDKDYEAIEYARRRLSQIGDNFLLIHGDFRDIDRLLADTEFRIFDGILGDLGVSSPQIDNPARGFSYTRSGPLDMRMDERRPLRADEIVNEYSQEQLRQIFAEYAIPKYALRVARAIVASRPIRDTGELVSVIRDALPAAEVRRKHPARAIFQALRIVVNDEIGALEELLTKLDRFTAQECVIALITFHSLEDSVVRRYYARRKSACDNYRRPVSCAETLTTKTLRASVAEIYQNPRARSAQLRVIKIQRRSGGISNE